MRPGRRARGLLRAAASVLLLTGALVIADVAATLLWQEPVTAFLARHRQGDLARQLDRIPAPSPAQRRAVASLDGDRARLAVLARQFGRHPRTGAPAGRIRIPTIGASFVVVFGTDHDSLSKGPGLYPSQPLPGAHGTAAIAGHRTTYLAPFRHVDRLRKGDEVRVDMPYGRFVYRVVDHRSVTPDSLWVLRRRPYDSLVLSACDPPFSAARRLIVFTRLVHESLRPPSS
jgi:sortase A